MDGKEQYIVFKNDKNSASKAFLGVLVLLGIFYCLDHPVIGGLLFFLASIMLLSRNGTVVDIKNRRYKKAVMIGSIAFAHWQDIPQGKYLSVFGATMVSSTSSLSGKYFALKNKILKINLVFGSNQRLTLYQSVDKEDAWRMAGYFSDSLGLPVFDAEMGVRV